jgi:hypothetical protein
MATIRILDRPDSFRVTISGQFAGECVGDVASTWKHALAQSLSRRFKVDISALTGYDTAGYKLLRDMYRHGTLFAAGTPLSLVFLNEISGPLRRRAASATEPKPQSKSSEPHTNGEIVHAFAGRK